MTRIGNSAFSSCHGLTSVTIPNSVTSIGDMAFYGSTRIKNVYISDLDAWNTIRFANVYANPLFYGGKLYLNGEEVTYFAL